MKKSDIILFVLYELFFKREKFKIKVNFIITIIIRNKTY